MLGLVLVPVGGPQTAEAAPVQELAPEVYYAQTGHHVSELFLEYWWNNGGLDTFGFPLTEDLTIDGKEVQYFERARLEWHPENPSGFRVLLGHLGRELAASHSGPSFDRTEAPGYQDTADRRYFPETGHFLAYGFKAYWESYGDLPIFGYPISEEFLERNPDTGQIYTVQYFERARFEYHPEHQGTKYEVQLGRIGHTLAQRAGVDMTPVAQHPDTPVWPDGMRTPAKWIEVNLAIPQKLVAWEGETPVFETPISAGTADNPTPTGTFEIFWKLEKDDMTGGLAGTSDYYYLPDVPWVMYFLEGGYAIHGTYWHTNFGYPMSHGCVNLSQDAAAWMYQWAPYGTKVWVHG